MSLAVTLTTARGVFSTRITVLEKEVGFLRDADKSQNGQLDHLRRQVRRLQAHQQEDELLLNHEFILLHRPLLQRRAKGTVAE